jgi:hypothetical protein
MSSTHVTYVPRSATPRADISALAAVYKFVLDCHAKNEAATSPVSRPDDEKGRSSSDSLATTDCTG